MIHSMKMFNLLAQSKPRIKIKTSSVYDYIPLFVDVVSLLPLLEVYFIGLFRNQLMDLAILLFLIH